MNKNREIASVQKCRRKERRCVNPFGLICVHLSFSVLAIPIKRLEAVLSMNGMVQQQPLGSCCNIIMTPKQQVHAFLLGNAHICILCYVLNRYDGAHACALHFSLILSKSL